MKKIFFVMLTFALLWVFCTSAFVNAAVITADGSFEKESVGTISNETEDFAKDWVEKNGLGETATSTVEEESGNKYLKASGLLELQSVKTVSKPYTFSVDLRTNTPAADWLGVFIRTGDVFNLYEWDFYVEKGGTEGTSSIGAAGIVIYPVIDGIRLAVKTRADGPWGISCAYTDILVEGNPDWKTFTNLKVEDDGSTVKIYVGNALTATVEMSGKGTYEEDSNTEIPEYLDLVFYKNVVVKDASGAERFRVDNARVVAEDAYLGIGVREKAIDIDNISISEPDGTPNTDERPNPDESQKPDETPKPNPGTGDLGLCAISAVFLFTATFLKKQIKSL